MKRVCFVSEFPPSGRLVFKDGPLDLVIFKVGSSFHAIDRKCSHAGGDLSKGQLEGTTIVCPVHEATFDIRTGKFVDIGYTSPLLARVLHDIKAYKVVVQDGIMFIEA